ncbi:hypothetical protein [Hazenella coriacea]|uniref:Uncharacterized protein n=1 Tax=Hazenella coriacea TaxID=1179467 RepID=A0A4R3L241_9BACL|nr:hypothetical protein [Hazenella coriacea]TCS93242.1 hypothetical protein EDD58_10856 [Hazenella coriacea]
MEWETKDIDGTRHIIIPKSEHEVTEQTFAQKHPIITNLLQAELAVAFLIISWFLINLFYQIGYLLKWNIPMNYLEIDLLLSANPIVVLIYITIVSLFLFWFLAKKPLSILREVPDGPYNYRKLTISIIDTARYLFQLLAGIAMIVSLLIIAYKSMTLLLSNQTQYTQENTLSFFQWVGLSYIIFTITTLVVKIPLPQQLKPYTKTIFKFLLVNLFIMSIIIVPFYIGYCFDYTLHKVYYNGKESNQVLINRYRDYYLIGYHDKVHLYPCFELVKLVNDEKLSTIHTFSKDNTSKSLGYIEENVVISSNQEKLKSYKGSHPINFSYLCSKQLKE